MVHTVSKEFSFDMAHRIKGSDKLFYDKSKCGSLHGHTIKVKVTLGLKIGANLNNFGFVLDFAEFKPLKKWIDENFDHSTIVSASDVELVSFLKAQGDRFFVVENGPASSEMIARIIFLKAQELLSNDNTQVLSVTVSESCTNHATVSAS